MKPGERQTSSGTDSELERDLQILRNEFSGDPAVGPPELIDQAILNRARRQVEKPGPPRRWFRGLATAAVAVLAISVVILQNERPVLPPTPDAAPPASEPEARSRKLSPMSADPVHAPAPGEGAEAAEVAAGDEERFQLMEEAGVAEFPAAPPAREDGDAVAGQSSRENQSSARIQSEAGPLSADKTLLRDESSAAPEEQTHPWRSDPKQWIEHLTRLKSSGQTEAFLNERALFMAAYPDFPVPPALRD